MEKLHTIDLIGHPYQQEVRMDNGIELIDANVTLEKLAQSEEYQARLKQDLTRNTHNLEPLTRGFGALDGVLKRGQNLSFEEAFSASVFVISALNYAVKANLTDIGVQTETNQTTHLMRATALLASLSTKESYIGLTPEEIAGLSSGVITTDLLTRVRSSVPSLGMGGMGGDRGFDRQSKHLKPFSVSTLSALALANIMPVHKHHSYPNTSKVAGQSAIEYFGARSDFESGEEMEELLETTGLLMSSAHTTKTIHTLSHLLRGETINHILGPLTIPHHATSPLLGFYGVNDKIPPQNVIEALAIMNNKGMQQFGNAVAFGGTGSTSIQNPEFEGHSIMVDEIAPPPFITIASFLVRGKPIGTFTLGPQDFYPESALSDMNVDSILVPNDPEAILDGNADALLLNGPRTKYLAMNVGLGIFLQRYADSPSAFDTDCHTINRDLLRRATEEAEVIIRNGIPVKILENYVATTRRIKNSHE